MEQSATLPQSEGLDSFRRRLETEVADQEQIARRRVTQWNFRYYTTLFGTILCSASAALIPQIESLPSSNWQTDVASILAAISAVLATIMYAGGFERRWQASRKRLTATSQLRIELLDPQADIEQCSKHLAQILEAYNQEVTGATNPPKK